MAALKGAGFAIESAEHHGNMVVLRIRSAPGDLTDLIVH